MDGAESLNGGFPTYVVNTRECPCEEARAGVPQAGFCEGEVHNGAGSNTVTLPTPKGGSNREYKADLTTGGVLPTRPGRPCGHCEEASVGHCREAGFSQPV
jgi:hypothetical protein